MARLSTFLLCAFCAAILPSLALPSASPFTGSFDYSASDPALEISRGSLEHTQISLRSPKIEVSTQRAGFENGQVFLLAGEPFIPEEGSPALPQVTRFYRIPNTGSVELNLETLGFDLLDNINPLPYYEGETVTRNADVYSRDGWYPPEVAVMSAPMQLRDFRVVQVTLYPVQVNPVTHQARVYHTIDVSLLANSTPGENEIIRTRRPSGAWSPIYRSLIANLDESALDDATTTPGTYLILAKASPIMQPWVDSLTAWKRQLGYDVIVDARTNWTSSSMTTVVRNQYTQADPPLEYVALMGDPSWTNGVPSGSNSSYSGDLDHVFALGNTSDDLEDIGVGRLSGATSAEMATIMFKLLNYERDPWMTDSTGGLDSLWFQTGIFYAGISHWQYGAYNLMQWSAQQFDRYTGVTNNHVAWHNGTINEDTLRAWCAPGVGYFFWRGGWVGEMPAVFPATLGATRKLPVVSIISEMTGDFIGSQAISEAFLVAGTPAAPRGGVCAIGTAGSYQYGLATTLSGGLTYSIANAGVENISNALAAAKAWVTLTYGRTSSNGQRMVRVANLMGEPSMRLWTDVPVVMSVSHADTLAIGTHAASVVVHDARTGEPVPEALVVFWKGTETYARALTDGNGAATLPINVATAGVMTLTVSKRNHKPYVRGIPCTQAVNYVALSSYVLDDDQSGGTFGNGDHLPNPGETVDLNVALRNYSATQTAQTVSALLSSTNSHVVVLSSTSMFSSMQPGDTAIANTPFHVRLSAQMVHHERALLTLRIVADGDTTVSAIELVCRAGRLDPPATTTCVPALAPGEVSAVTMPLLNSGPMDIFWVSARLVSLSPWIIVTDSLATFGGIPAGLSATNSEDPFSVSVSIETYHGHVAPMLLIVDADSLIETLQFVLTVGQPTTHDPAGPDVFGYLAFDNTDTGCVMHPTYSYVSIEQTGNNLGLDDPGREIELTRPWSIARVLPFPFKFYGQVYDSITINSNGWCAFGDQSWNGAFLNFAIPAMVAPDAMIAPYWDELKTLGMGLGVWDYYDEANGRYVIQWKAQGADVATALDFEVILMDTTSHPTRDGNGMILLQYRDVTMNLSDYSEDPPNGCTIGIQAPRGLVGLPYAYGTTYSPGAAPMLDGCAVLFTTEGNVLLPAENPTQPLPKEFALYPNYPNPFNPATQIRFDLPKAAHIRLTVYNSLGQAVRTLIDENRSAGTYSIVWDGADFATGLYFYRLEAGSFVQTKKMLLIK